MKQIKNNHLTIILLLAILASLFVSVPKVSAATIGTNTFTTGWATFGQVVPQGVAFQGLQVGSFPTQTDVKNRWADGSIKFAIVTANITSAGSYAINTASTSSGLLTPSNPSASVTFNISGINYIANLPNTVSSDLWLNGPLVKEWRNVVTPMAGATPHPLLRVYFDTRVYSDGKARVDIDVENTLDVTGGDDVTYDVNINIGGSQIFSQSGINHFYLTRWRKVYTTNGLVEAETYHDFSPFITSGLIPNYDASLMTNTNYSFNGTYVGTKDGRTYQDFGILGKGGATVQDMWSPGGRSELALYPEWIAQYIGFRTQNLRQYTLLSGNQAGSWSVHIRQSNGFLISSEQHPNYFLDSRCGGGPDCPLGNLNLNNNLSGYNNQHASSYTYIPYLISGDRYYMDETQFYGNMAVLSVWPACGPNYSFCRAGGVVLDGEEARGIAWSVRNIVDAALISPDADAYKTYFTNIANNNLVALDQFSNGQRTRKGFYVNPYGSNFEYYTYFTDGQVHQPQWQNNYVAWVLDHALSAGFSAGTATRNRIAAYQLKLFNSEAVGYPRAHAAPYYPSTGTMSDENTITWIPTMGELYTFNIANNPNFGPADLFSGYYGPDARISLIIAIKAGMPGAQEAYDWLMTKLYPSDFTGKMAISLSGSPSPTPPPPPPPPPTPQPIVGDINLDHIVNSIDYSILNSDWFTSNSRSDLNRDQIVNAIDYSLLNANWLRTW
ncbi:MAG: hypothetical protein A3C49_00015 [Candidatus Doudnabacteria bacterium RIFCSPHIGHO2_02_FULL_42_25]|uniref:Dockerin domain-containing protein n=1 Tax=Candidatus Doudnabacteria bacterium RIFCSPHIGHO2_01_FULL_41_86 TaxID=1817821 RepID=A0A1F5N837_9BACT|nr:MAG: hypothetical protein A2717_00015 [Candidatus Doudnabacteria bacterium RIFCSPHIGHO2_01_FULL_41_86]OGE85606.1 MAG: hypothetical protein A3E28_04580 [Candidatus Doudnabacteria bacterium RIFCSPHIGHO2_12_FULL_42_22]OGE86543.1 MAG: hypothetical protein A3C49_00015 [Candidatus Doudnabacteria bacterium RIFCSPHIGHO2_02_FULL_42_25]OGE91960.1 MAG: hypothetical protein A2895_01160 [Candidatus Doudnabacteria bacterium RIFCSPLOWO2_01_FULL_42_60]